MVFLYIQKIYINTQDLLRDRLIGPMIERGMLYFDWWTGEVESRRCTIMQSMHKQRSVDMTLSIPERVATSFVVFHLA